MRSAEAILADLDKAALDHGKHQRKGAELHDQLCALLREAREHPEVSMETARQRVSLPRQTAYEYARKGGE
ncbi:MAG TPA: hypothetical protein VF245_12920 [Solirubrobacterales bacterium]